MDKPSARTASTEDTPTLKSRSAHLPTRPLTKSVAPRLSTTSRTTPTATTPSTRPATTSSLSKPPARPATTTTLRAARTTPSTTVPTHQKRQSASSVDEKPSGDEKSKDGISARPKRMSLAPSTSSERTSTVTARRTTLQPSTARQSTTSPTGARKVPSTPSIIRTMSTPRTKPLTSSTSRNLGAATIGDKKRLSTIPASPAIKSDVEESGDNKENFESDVEKKLPTRPALGSRKSTRSVLIEQQIREFELVSSMLQQAIASDGVDDQEQQSINDEAAASIAKLKTDLAKVRQFERENGRLPTESELDQVPEDVTADGLTQNGENESSQAEDLKGTLADKQMEIEALKSELLSWKQKLEDFGKSAEEEASRVQVATEAIRAEHASKVEELSTLQEEKLKTILEEHQKELKILGARQQSELDALKDQLSRELSVKQSETSRLETELAELHTATLKAQSEKDAEIEALKLDLKAKTLEVETASEAEASPSPSPDHEQKLAEAQSRLEAAQSRHLAAKDNAKTKIAKLQEDFDTKVSTLSAQHEEQLAELKSKLDKAELDVASKTAQVAKQSEEHAKIDGEVSRQAQVIEALKSQVLAFQQFKKDDHEAQALVIEKLESEIESLKQEKLSATEASSALLATAEKSHSEKLEAVEQQLNAARDELEKANASHQAQLEEAVRKAQSDLSAAIAEMEALKSSHNSQLDELKGQLLRANESATSGANQHEEALATLRTQLDDATAAITEATNKHELLIKEHTIENSSAEESIAGLKEQLVTANAAVADAISKHESLSKSHESQTAFAQDELATLKTGHAVQIQELEQKLELAAKEVLSAKQLHASQIKQLEVQMQATLKDLDTLEAGNVEAIRRVQAEASEAQQKAVEEAEQVHIQRVRELEQQLNAAEQQQNAVQKAQEAHVQREQELKQQLNSAEDRLKALQDEHSQRERELQQQVNAVESQQSNRAGQLEEEKERMLQEHDLALAELKSSHAKNIAAVEAQLKSAKESAEASTAAHTQQLQLLEEDANSRFAAEIESLKTKHANELESIQQSNQLARDEALEGLSASLAQEKKVLESQAKSLKADLENTQFQFQNLKGIFQSVEEEGKDKDREHDEAIEKLQEELSLAVRKLADHSSRAMDLQMQHDEALANVKSTLESKSQEDIEKTKFEHEKHLNELRATLEAEHKEALAKLQAEHAASLEAAQTSTQAQIAELQWKAKEEHDEHMDQIMKTLESQWKSQVDQLEEDKAAASARLATLTTEHESTLQEIETQHQTALTKLETELQEAHSAATALKDTSDLDASKAQLAEALEKIQTMQTNHTEAMVAAYAKHESALNSAREDLVAAQKSAEQRKDPADFEELNSKYIEAQKALEKLHDENELVARETKAEYDTKYEKLLIELKESQDSSKARSDPAELDAANTRLQDAQKTISALQADLEGALLEVDTQRGLAASAQQEIQQLKQQSAATTLASPIPRRRSRSPKRKSMNPLSPTAENKGLASSRWATPDDAPASTAETPASPPTGLRGGAADPDALVEAPSEAKQTEEKPSKHNVAGQLAGIQEQIRQLDEISEDFLVEHQRMARTLSKVDDQTETPTTVEVESEES
ncbi:hypothetical protein LTR84_003839 [Exophiala bonariae]|uniref:M protein repeat protein n=1 Tax=Exophiala bonariae TaxID=1690606 RepID=A0AAV9N6L2_9EURO|nr:hypothetical protein LTR84_003839 [Exophiala bonariae]